MNLFILKFRSEPIGIPTSDLDIKYSNELNLNVLRSNNGPAILLDQMGTNTFTKTGGEVSDTDNSIKYYSQVDTTTFTRVVNETSDSDV